MWVIAISIVGSVVASIIVTKILATHYFEIVDGYVSDMCVMSKKFTEDIMGERTRGRNPFPKE